eukprot:753374-Hanusia_phi.AAC.3
MAHAAAAAAAAAAAPASASAAPAAAAAPWLSNALALPARADRMLLRGLNRVTPRGAPQQGKCSCCRGPQAALIGLSAARRAQCPAALSPSRLLPQCSSAALQCSAPAPAPAPSAVVTSSAPQGPLLAAPSDLPGLPRSLSSQAES